MSLLSITQAGYNSLLQSERDRDRLTAENSELKAKLEQAEVIAKDLMGEREAICVIAESDKDQLRTRAEQYEAKVKRLEEALTKVHNNWSDCFHDATSTCFICKALAETGGGMTKPRTFYLTVFPDTFKDRTYFEERDLAERFLMHVGERKGIWGFIVEVEPVKKRKKQLCEDHQT